MALLTKTYEELTQEIRDLKKERQDVAFHFRHEPNAGIRRVYFDVMLDMGIRIKDLERELSRKIRTHQPKWRM